MPRRLVAILLLPLLLLPLAPACTDEQPPPDPGCRTAADCPAETASEPYCDGDVVRDRTTFECVAGECVEATSQEVVEDCPERAFCLETACTDRPVLRHDRALPTDRPLELLFVGNSFTATGDVPGLVADLAAGAGWPRPATTLRAVGGYDLHHHRSDADTLAAVDRGGFDVVILQDFSTRPTDAMGNPLGFKDDAAWFYERARAASPEALVLLYETWARHPDHEVYPLTFPNAAEMQAQLRFHYNDAALGYVPGQAAGFAGDLFVAPVGDAWERHLTGPDPLVLHQADLYHAGPAGWYLAALVLYGSVYGCGTEGLNPAPVSLADGLRLQADADGLLGTAPCRPRPPSFPAGARALVDFGGYQTPTGGAWNDLDDCFEGRVDPLVTVDGLATTGQVQLFEPFGGANVDGPTGTSLGHPDTATGDSCFSGSFDGHEAGLERPARVALIGLPPEGRYTLRLFASRMGADGELDRLVRFRVGGTWADVEATDNTSEVAVLSELAPSGLGTLLLEVGPSPAGTGRFGYLGVLEVERTR